MQWNDLTMHLLRFSLFNGFSAIWTRTRTALEDPAQEAKKPLNHIIKNFPWLHRFLSTKGMKKPIKRGTLVFYLTLKAFPILLVIWCLTFLVHLMFKRLLLAPKVLQSLQINFACITNLQKLQSCIMSNKFSDVITLNMGIGKNWMQTNIATKIKFH